LFSVNWNQKRIIVTEQAAVLSTPNTINCTVRNYLTAREVEQLMDHARKHSRYGHRDSTMILVAYRHGLRASELCDLQWCQVELDQGRMHVHRAKNGTPSVHPSVVTRSVPYGDLGERTPQKLMCSLPREADR
jgi:site-specific recombinase XerD